MEVELFVHGVPSGEGFWGKEEDRNYFGTFYDHSSDEVKFLIQTRALKGKPYCYYNYLVYKTVGSQTPNVVANDGRDGSYFGITLRLDAYCKDIVNMYRILDTVFNVYVMGNLLKMEKTKLKYTTPDFTSVSNVLEGIEKATIQLIQNAFSSDSFARLDGFAMSGSSYPTSNLYDCTTENVMAAVKQYSRMAVSPYYPSGKEAAIQQQCNAQIQAVQQQCDARLKADADARAKEKNEISTSLSSAKNQVSQLQREIGQKDGTISQLNGEVSRLQSEIRNMGQSKKVAQIVAPIKEPIVELATILKRMIPESSERKINGIGKNPNDEHKKDFEFSILKMLKSFLPFLNLLLLLIIVGTLLNPFKDKHTDDINSDAMMAKIESLERENQELQEQLEIARTAGNGVTQDVFTTATPFNMEPVRIDIQGFNGGDLSLHTTYNVEAKQGAENGTWKGEGCEIYPTENPNKVKVIPTADVVKIIYCVGDKTKIRELKAK